MDDLLATKGLETLVAAILRDDYLIRLQGFNDASWTIDRDETHLGVWEHGDIPSCLNAFFQTLTRPAEHAPLWLNSDKATPASSLPKFTGADSNGIQRRF